jgi:hypothetical protein
VNTLPPRHTADTITDDALDALYAELDALRSSFSCGTEGCAAPNAPGCPCACACTCRASGQARSEHCAALGSDYDRLESARRWAVALENENAALLAELGDRDEAARERWIETQLAETRLRSADFRSGMSMEIEPARELVAHWVGAARAMLGDAPNYSETPIEMEVKVGESPERFAFVLQRVAPDALTPHQARQRAEEERDAVYRERAQLLALLATHPAVHTAVLAPADDIDEPGWHLLYLHTPAGQLSWHIHPRDAALFASVEQVTASDPRAQWDGHTTGEKYDRVRALAAADTPTAAL